MPTFDLPTFLAAFPEFDDEAKWKKTVLQSAGYRASMHLSVSAVGMPLQGEQREYARFLVAAHILTLAKMNEDNGDDSGAGMPGMPFKATIGSVQVENTKPNTFTSDDWTFWYSQTLYGREYLALLDSVVQGVYLATQSDSVRDLP